MKVLFISTYSYPRKIPSDKQFLNDLIDALPGDVEPAIWTLNDDVACPMKMILIGSKNVLFANRPFSFFGHRVAGGTLPLSRLHPLDYRMDRLTFASFLLSASYSLFKSLNGSLREMISTHNPQVVHFVDDLGPAIWLLRLAYPAIIITCSKPVIPSKSAKWNLLYRMRTKIGLNAADTVIAFTDICRENLKKIGVKSQIVTIPWGIKLPRTGGVDRLSVRSQIGCCDEDFLTICSPRNVNILLEQCILQCASFAANPRYKYIFLIRPTMWNDSYSKLSNGNIRLMRSPSNYLDIIESSDLLFAPQGRQHYTALPPLLWIEALARGIPIITERNPGVDSVIRDGYNGFLFDFSDADSMVAAFEKVGDPILRRRMKDNARKGVIGIYDIDLIAEQYDILWKSLLTK
jgi:hypothetical protein